MTSETENSKDGLCQEDDGCPTETAVLKREWRHLTAKVAALEYALRMDEDLISMIQKIIGILSKRPETPNF